MIENYKEQVVHVTGGMNDWVGELDTTPHKNGSNWIRIKNPCKAVYGHDKSGNEAIRLMAVYNAGTMYKKYVDIRLPDDPAIEILTLLKDGDLMKNYMTQVTREKSTIIQMPNSGLNLQ